jgi:hypothetical protein
MIDVLVDVPWLDQAGGHTPGDNEHAPGLGRLAVHPGLRARGKPEALRGLPRLVRQLLDRQTPRGCAHASDRTSLRSVPSPEIVTLTRSPGARKICGSRLYPTPDGVPVAMMSPGSRVMSELM